MIDAVVITEHGKYVVKHPAIPLIKSEIYWKRYDRIRWMEGAQREWNHRRKPKR